MSMSRSYRKSGSSFSQRQICTICSRLTTSVTSPWASETSCTASAKRSMSLSAADLSPLMALRHHALEFIDDRLLRHCPNDALRRLPVLEHQEGRDALDAIRRSRAGIIVDVQLHDFELALIVAGDLLDDGCNGPAWTTPHRPKVDQDRLRRSQNFLLERAISTSIAFAIIGSLL